MEKTETSQTERQTIKHLKIRSRQIKESMLQLLSTYDTDFINKI